MDGFCVGEPWNNRAIVDGIGFTAITTQQMWPDHPEKVCAFTEEFAAKNPKTVKAVLKALHLASVHLDNLDNRAKAAEVVARADLHQLPAGDHPAAAARQLRLRRRPEGAGQVLHDLLRPRLQLPAARVRRVVADAVPALGHGQGGAGLPGVAKRVLRPDIYLEAMKEIGVTPKVAEVQKFTLFDGIPFDAKDPEKYAKSFPVQQSGVVTGALHDATRRYGFLLPLTGIVAGRPALARGEPVHPRSAVAAQDVGGEQAVSARAVREARRDGSGHRAPRLLQPRPGGEGVSPRRADRDAARPAARAVADAAPDVRSGHPDPPADLAAGMAAARARRVPEIRAGRAVRHCHLLDVADGDQQRGRRAAPSRRTTGTSRRCCACRGSRPSRRS